MRTASTDKTDSSINKDGYKQSWFSNSLIGSFQSNTYHFKKFEFFQIRAQSAPTNQSSPSLLQMSPLSKTTLYLLLGVVSFILSTNAAVRVRDPRLPQRLSARSKGQNTHFIPFKVFNHFLKEHTFIRFCFTARG